MRTKVGSGLWGKLGLWAWMVALALLAGCQAQDVAQWQQIAAAQAVIAPQLAAQAIAVVAQPALIREAEATGRPIRDSAGSTESTPRPSATPTAAPSATPTAAPSAAPTALAAMPTRSSPIRRLPTAEPGGIPPLDLGTTDNFLLLGTDTRAGEDVWRTDSIMVLGVDYLYNRAALLSIPRDLLVDIPGIGQRRLNQVDYFGEKVLKSPGGGPALFSQVLSNTIGIQTNHWIRVDMNSFRDFVDIIGGVTVNLECPYYELYKDDATGIFYWYSLPAGDVIMDGETAFMFVRLRYLNTDNGRASRQRQFLWALREQAMSANLILKMPELWRLFRNSFDTDLSLFRILELGNFGLSLSAENVRAGAITTKDLERYITPAGADVLRIHDPERVQAIIDNIWTAPPLSVGPDSSTVGCPPAPAGIPTSLLQEIPLSAQEVVDEFPAWAVEAGTEVVVVNTGGRSIRLRSLPSLTGTVLNAYQAGDRFQVLSPDSQDGAYPVEQDGFQWVKVGTPSGESGWIAARYLAPVNAEP